MIIKRIENDTRVPKTYSMMDTDDLILCKPGVWDAGLIIIVLPITPEIGKSISIKMIQTDSPITPIKIQCVNGIIRPCNRIELGKSEYTLPYIVYTPIAVMYASVQLVYTEKGIWDAI